MGLLSGLLHRTFGFSSFRVNQEAVCRAATDGKDVLLVMPTGAGKSLCYQLPALARGGTGLVISPLIALMDDQANKLVAAGLRVARIHSGMSREDSRQACRDYLDGHLQFLFIAPERMRVPGFPEMLSRRKPSLIAIDEAHCISAWGHDFRPDYRTLGDYLPALRPAPIIALTATATPTVQHDIVTQLSLHQPALFIHGFRRDNLHIEVLELSKPRRTEFTKKFLSDAARRPAIVYAPSRKAADELAGELGRHFPAAAYHAGLDSGTRERVQRHFQSGKLEVVVATIAFGMGIDKADVRTVVHYALPASVEAYYQEIGRAGRDGKPSRTVLLYNFVDRKMHDFFLDRDYPVTTELTKVTKVLTDDFQMPEILRKKLKMDVETFAKAGEKLASQGAAVIDMAGNIRRGATSTWQSGYESQVAHRRGQIDRMMDFAQTQQCRMTALIRHFGDTADAHRPCGHCDFCAPGATQAQILAEPTAQQDRDLRIILRSLAGGSKSTGKLFIELGLTKERKDFDDLLDGLARGGLITLNSETFTAPEGKVIPYKKASLTFEGQSISSRDALGVVLRSESGTTLPSRKRKINGTTPARTRTLTVLEAAPLTSGQQTLAINLRAWRKAEAAVTGKPAFMVFSDSALGALAMACPQNLAALLQVTGFGPDKTERYGTDIVALCRANTVPPAPASNSSASRADSSTRASAENAAERPQKDSLKTPAPASKILALERSVPIDPAVLTPVQQAREVRLRQWRKSESERLGLPQFFVLGTSALRSIAMEQPRTLAELQLIPGVGVEKVDRYGPSILQVCNA